MCRIFIFILCLWSVETTINICAVVVGILAILVTALLSAQVIHYQIFKAELKKHNRKIDKKINDVAQKCVNEMGYAQFYQLDLQSRNSKNIEAQIISQFMLLGYAEDGFRDENSDEVEPSKKEAEERLVYLFGKLQQPISDNYFSKLIAEIEKVKDRNIRVNLNAVIYKIYYNTISENK